MKQLSHLTYLLLLIIFCACQETPVATNSSTEKQDSTVVTADTVAQALEKPNKPQKTKTYSYKYVSEKYGTNYYSRVDTTVKGKVALNTFVKVCAVSKPQDVISDNDSIHKSDWVSIELDNDTFFILDSHISEWYTHSDIQIYYSRPFRPVNDYYNFGFLNLSEAIKVDTSVTLGNFPSSQIGKSKFTFNNNYRNQFLKSRFFKPSDTVYIYNLAFDSIVKCPINKLDLIASVSIYSYGDESLSEEEYEIGFDLDSIYTLEGGNFTFIGSTCPFQQGHLQPLLFDTVANFEFPIETNLDTSLIIKSYKMRKGAHSYFVQTTKTSTARYGIHKYQMVVVNNQSDSIVLNNTYHESESTSLTAPPTVYNDDGIYYSWTGKVFKNKPEIIYGTVGHSFGCPSIVFIQGTEPSIPILCDNRH